MGRLGTASSTPPEFKNRAYRRSGCVVVPVFAVISLLLHGLGHALALLLATGEAAYLTGSVITEGLGWRPLLAAIQSPAHFARLHGGKPPAIVNRLPSPGKIRFVAVGGFAMNVLSGVVALWLSAESGPWLWPVAALFIITALLCAASQPDLFALLNGRASFWACGPAFAIRYKLSAEEQNADLLATDRLCALVEILTREASTRGGQSAGFAMIASKQNQPSIVFDKVVKGKRQDIVKVLCARMLDLLRKTKKEGVKKPGPYEVVLLHLRYATGGATHWHNAQPHWYEHYDAMRHHSIVDGIVDGKLVSKTKEVFNLIAHNGDMDAVYLDICVDGRPLRQMFEQSEARTIFQTMMPVTTSKGDSDSRSVAEWVDFLLTQGLTYKALRYAYVTRALDFNSELTKGRFDLNQLHHWSDQIELVLLNTQTQDPSATLKEGARSLDDLNDSVKASVRQALKTQAEKVLTEAVLEPFLDVFEDAFYRHDLTWVMRQASRNLVGEFALMVCTTLEPRMGVFSLTQAFSLGHNRSKGEIFGSAEPQGVTSSLHRGDSGDDALQINLEDGQYATVEFEKQHGRDAILIYDRVKESDDSARPALPSAKTLLEGADISRSNWFPVNNNPKIDRLTQQDFPGEEVNRDIRDIPYVLRRVVDSFKAGGENFLPMAHLSRLLFANMQDPQRDRDKYDLVLYGVDFNQDLVGEFPLALASVLPDVKVRAENSGNVLKEMKRSKREGIGRYGPKTLFLGVSNSAQTQSTLAAMRKAVELVGPERCFVLTQSFLNSMSQALDQGYHPEDPLLPNTFVNLSHWPPDGTCGRRRSEAATLVPVATQAVLTEILIGLLQRAIEQRPALCAEAANEPAIEIRHDMQMADVNAFRDFQSAVYEVEIPHRVGRNWTGDIIDKRAGKDTSIPSPSGRGLG